LIEKEKKRATSTTCHTRKEREKYDKGTKEGGKTNKGRDKVRNIEGLSERRTRMT